MAKPNVEQIMKVELNVQGVLKVTPENDTEAYALKCWSQDFAKDGGTAVLTIDPTFPLAEKSDDSQ